MDNKSKILIVDDDPINIHQLTEYLSPWGYEIFCISKGKDALKMIAEQRIDLVLLDILMPDMDGLDICRSIKADEKTKFLPVIMVTVLKKEEGKIIAIEFGADEFLTKPVNEIELVVRVKSLLKTKHLHDELEKSYTKLKELEKTKEELSAMIAHDIKNIVNGIEGNLDLALGRAGDLSEEIKNYLGNASQASEDLNSLVSDFIDISKIEENKLTLHLEQTDINKLIWHILEDMKALARSSGINILPAGDINKALYFNLDKNLVSRVLINLLVNAIKFTPKGGNVNVGAAMEEGNLRVFVKDSGIGILPEYREKIFEKFVQLESGQPHLECGRGLGLAFCKHAVELHGGKILVESEGKNKGSSFIFTLPK